MLGSLQERFMPGALPFPPPLPLARFSVEQYHLMIESGAFTEDDGLELIEGWVVRKMAKGPAHEYSTGRIDDFLRQHVPVVWHVRNQAPLTLARSEPEPDLAVVRGGREAYRDRHPGGHDVALVIEVSDTSLSTDRLKARSYGEAGIPIYWIVNLSERCVEVYTNPASGDQEGYRDCRVLHERDDIRLVIEGEEHGSLAVALLLP
jgi:Uma2 family endonuclease